MLKQTSKEFKTFFLLQFTKELIKNSRQGAMFGLKNLVREKDEEIKREIDRLIKTKKPSPSGFEESIMEKTPFEFPRQRFKPIQQPQPKIPQPQLPPRLQYLKPIPTSRQIDLGKLNPLMQDEKVTSIECNKADEPLMVKIPELKKTRIVLNQEEIDQTIQKFSEATKIPTHDGVYKVAIGKLILSATISGGKTSKFVIEKIKQEQQIIPQKHFKWETR